MTRARSKAALERAKGLAGGGEARVVIQLRAVAPVFRRDVEGRSHRVAEAGAHHPQCPTCTANPHARGATLVTARDEPERVQRASARADHDATPGKACLGAADGHHPYPRPPKLGIPENIENQDSGKTRIDDKFDPSLAQMRAFRTSPAGQELIQAQRRSAAIARALHILLLDARGAPGRLEKASEQRFAGKMSQAEYEEVERDVRALTALAAGNAEDPEAVRLVREVERAVDAGLQTEREHAPDAEDVDGLDVNHAPKVRK